MSIIKSVFKPDIDENELKYYRELNGFTIHDLSYKIGVSVTNLKEIEEGRSERVSLHWLKMVKKWIDGEQEKKKVIDKTISRVIEGLQSQFNQRIEQIENKFEEKLSISKRDEKKGNEDNYSLDSFGELFKKERWKLRLNVVSFADAIGVHITTVQNWENGAKTPSSRSLASIRKKFPEMYKNISSHPRLIEGVDAVEIYGKGHTHRVDIRFNSTDLSLIKKECKKRGIGKAQYIREAVNNYLPKKKVVH